MPAVPKSFQLWQQVSLQLDTVEYQAGALVLLAVLLPHSWACVGAIEVLVGMPVGRLAG